MTSITVSQKVYTYPFDKTYTNFKLTDNPFVLKTPKRQESIIVLISIFTDNLSDNKQIYDYNGPNDIWSKIWENEDC